MMTVRDFVRRSGVIGGTPCRTIPDATVGAAKSLYQEQVWLAKKTPGKWRSPATPPGGLRRCEIAVFAVKGE